jgi:hypothetical protein
MLRRIVVETAAAIGPLLFLTCALRPGCGFNFIPFAIHQSMLGDSVDEYVFIVGFNVGVALFLFIAMRAVLRKSFMRQTAGEAEK